MGMLNIDNGSKRRIYAIMARKASSSSGVRARAPAGGRRVRIRRAGPRSVCSSLSRN